MRTLLFFLCCSFLLFSEQVEQPRFAIKAQRAKNLKAGSVKGIQIFGERCSGTNYLTGLIDANLALHCSYPYGWKHFPCWYDTPFVQKVLPSRGEKYCYLSDSDPFLFLVIFRDPYDWLRSFYNKPHHVSRKVSTATFGRFLRSKWYSEENAKGKLLGSRTKGILDRNPYTDKPFKNVLKLRSARIKNMLKIQEKVANVYYVKYETVRDFPEQVIDEISSFFQIPRKEIFTPIMSYRNENKEKFIPKKYFSIKPKDLLYIQRELDWEIEKEIGYSCQKILPR